MTHRAVGAIASWCDTRTRRGRGVDIPRSSLPTKYTSDFTHFKVPDPTVSGAQNYHKETVTIWRDVDFWPKHVNYGSQICPESVFSGYLGPAENLGFADPRERATPWGTKKRRK